MSCFARGRVRMIGGVLSPSDLCYGEDFGGSSNGRTSGFGPENRGSNPCPPAERRLRERDARATAARREPSAGRRRAHIACDRCGGALAPPESVAGGIASLSWPHQPW